MATNVPPFADESAYATALGELVPDTKDDRADADFIDDAIGVYAEHFPAWETADIGDGSTEEWELGKSGEAFANFVLGYSDLFPLALEQLDSSGDPHKPRIDVAESEWWLDERYVSDTPEKYLVFQSAPSATAQYRVKWRKPWALANVPTLHQMAVVWMAADLKCTALASRYRKTVDAGSDLFDGVSVAEGYERDARKWRSKAMSRLGVGSSAQTIVLRGKVKRSRARVFHRGLP